MALTLVQLVDAVDKYAHLTGAKAEAALERNLELLRGRVTAVTTAAKALAPEAPEVLSSDPTIAIHQLLAATGHPVQFDEAGATLALDPKAVIADATPEQISELALLGFFGQKGTRTDVDYSLWERYYDQDQDGNATPKAEYADGGTWQAYIASKA